MSTTDNAYAAFFYQQISLAALASLRNAAGAGVLGQGIDLLVNNHCVLHGTPDENVKSIQMNGFKDSTCGMLGCGVYGAHSYDKAKGFAGQDGTVFRIRFRGDKVCCTDTTDLSGSWRENGYDCIHCDRPGRRTEMCFPEQNITSFSEYTGSLSQDAHLKIDKFFLENPTVKNAVVYIGVGASIYSRSRLGASLGANVGIAMSCLFDNIVGKSTKVTKEEIEKIFAEAVEFGTHVGLAGGGATFVAAAAATTEVAAGGIWGWMGYTTTVAAYSTTGAAAVAGTVALPLAAVAAGAYAVWKLQSGSCNRKDDSHETSTWLHPQLMLDCVYA